MAFLPTVDGSFKLTHTMTASNLKTIFSTENKFLDKNIALDITAQAGVAALTCSLDASTDSSAATGNGTNVSTILANKSSTEPSSGNFIAIEVNGTGSATVSTAGWFNTGSISSSSSAANSTIKYFTITSATGTVTGTNTVTPSASLSGSNVTLGSTDTGISVTATGGGSASVSAVANIITAGYAAQSSNFATNTLSASSTTTTTTQYISAITIPISKSLSITNNGTATIISGSTSVGTVEIQAKISNSDINTTNKEVINNGLWKTTAISSAGTYYGRIIVSNGAITNNTTLDSGASSSGTINRGSYIKIGKGYYDNDIYYLAQSSNGTTIEITQSGDTAVDGYSYAHVDAANFANTGTSGIEYSDISSDAPVLISNDYLYINAGYISNSKISLAKLVPDEASANLASSVILSGYAAYDNSGILIAGNIATYDGTYSIT